MPNFCCVGGCSNRPNFSRNWYETVSLHRFPSQKAKATVWRAWQNFIQQRRSSNWEPGSSAFVCSKHFTDDSFANKEQYLFGANSTPPMKFSLRLKPDAVPSINVPSTVESPDLEMEGPSEKRERRTLSRLAREAVLEYESQESDANECDESDVSFEEMKDHVEEEYADDPSWLPENSKVDEIDENWDKSTGLGQTMVSSVWNYFTKVDRDKAECSICQNLLSCKQGTTSAMRRHLAIIHDVKVPVRRKMTLKNDQVVVPSQKSTSGVWKYFTKVGCDKVECDICHDFMAYKHGSTKSLMRHLDRIHDVKVIPMERDSGKTQEVNDDLPSPPYVKLVNISNIRGGRAFNSGDLSNMVAEDLPTDVEIKIEPGNGEVHVQTMQDVTTTRHTAGSVERDATSLPSVWMTATTQRAMSNAIQGPLGNVCGLCWHTSERKRLRFHVEQHFLKYFCSCGARRMSRDEMKEHQQQQCTLIAARRRKFVVDKESYPEFVRFMGWDDPPPFGYCKPRDSYDVQPFAGRSKLTRLNGYRRSRLNSRVRRLRSQNSAIQTGSLSNCTSTTNPVSLTQVADSSVQTDCPLPTSTSDSAPANDLSSAPDVLSSAPDDLSSAPDDLSSAPNDVSLANNRLSSGSPSTNNSCQVNSTVSQVEKEREAAMLEEQASQLEEIAKSLRRRADLLRAGLP